MATSLRYPKLRPYGSVTRLPRTPRNRRVPSGYLVAFYDDTGRWLGQISADTLEQAKSKAAERKIMFDSFVCQKC